MYNPFNITHHPTQPTSENIPMDIPISIGPAPHQPIQNSTILSILKNNNNNTNPLSQNNPSITTHTQEDPLQKSLAPFIPSVTPSYIYRYPQISDAIQTTHEVINEWKPDTAQGKYELEARFGKWCGQYFQSGVSKQFTEKILHMFETFSDWEKIVDWEETHDYYYTSPNQVLNQPLVRTTVMFQNNPQNGKKGIVTEHLRKYPKRKIDLVYTPFNSSQKGNTFPPYLHDSQYDLRVCLNYEEKVPEQELPSIINPSSVRIKSRKSYYYKSEECPSSDPIWKFDITRSWTGHSKSEAEIKQKNGETNYEIELECLNPQAAMISTKHDSFYVTTSLLLKMKDFIVHTDGPDDFQWQPLNKVYTNNEVGCF